MVSLSLKVIHLTLYGKSDICPLKTGLKHIMKPDDISLKTTSRLFSYEKISREIDTINSLDMLRDLAKSYAKLYMKQQEVIGRI